MQFTVNSALILLLTIFPFMSARPVLASLRAQTRASVLQPVIVSECALLSYVTSVSLGHKHTGKPPMLVVRIM